MTIEKLLKKKRIDKEMTVDELAKAVGVSYHTMLQRESGKTRWKPEEIVTVCEVLELTFDEFFSPITVKKTNDKK
jgi:DNA-binding XRE family transcriptional regulator